MCTYDYNFVSKVNRAYGRYPERFKSIVYSTLKSGTEFQRAFIEGYIDYLHNRGDYTYRYKHFTRLNVLCVPNMIKEGYSTDAFIPEFLEHNIYVTKVGWCNHEHSTSRDG